MLAPGNRRLLLEALRPPQDYVFDTAIGTTFTLDLVSLMTVPLALHLYDLEDHDGRPVLDPVALLDSLRQTAGRLTVFCDGGRIAVPAQQQRLFAMLEDMVVEARAPSGGYFHPKLWVIRYRSEASVWYRVLCASRNLTADRCWDLLLVLDGPLVDRAKAFAVNHPLADFIAALPNLAHRPASQAVRDRAGLLADEVRRVRFELPEDFDELRFWPLGLGKQTKPFARNERRRLVISPFVTDRALERLTEDGEGHILIARPEELAACRRPTLERFAAVYTLAPGADSEAELEQDGLLTGLHAKAVIGDGGWDSSVWVGSANATDAALSSNVEFVVELTGKKSKVGVDQVLAALQPILTSVDVAELPPAPATDERALSIDRARAVLAEHPFALNTTGVGDALTLNLITTRAIELADSIAVTAWPITLRQGPHQQPVGTSPGVVASFVGIAADSLSAFMAFEVSAGDGVEPARFVRALELQGAPADRMQRILKAVLANREQVLRMLLMLLAGEAMHIPPAGAEDAGMSTGSWMSSEGTLLESLLRTLHEAPARLDRVHGIVSELLADPEGRALLPAGFEKIWAPIWAARQGVLNV